MAAPAFEVSSAGAVKYFSPDVKSFEHQMATRPTSSTSGHSEAQQGAL
jgi:hypothetical protein